MKRIVIKLDRRVKRRLQRTMKKTKDAELRDRCRIILLYNEGLGCNAIAEKVGRVPATVVRVANRFRTEGEDGLQDRRKENGVPKVDADLLEALVELLGESPEDYTCYALDYFRAKKRPRSGGPVPWTAVWVAGGVWGGGGKSAPQMRA